MTFTPFDYAIWLAGFLLQLACSWHLRRERSALFLVLTYGWLYNAALFIISVLAPRAYFRSYCIAIFIGLAFGLMLVCELAIEVMGALDFSHWFTRTAIVTSALFGILTKRSLGTAVNTLLHTVRSLERAVSFSQGTLLLAVIICLLLRVRLQSPKTILICLGMAVPLASDLLLSTINEANPAASLVLLKSRTILQLTGVAIWAYAIFSPHEERPIDLEALFPQEAYDS